MTGTLAGALAARKIPTQPDRLTAVVEGFIENVDGKPLVTRIKVRYTVGVPKGKRPEDESRASARALLGRTSWGYAGGGEPIVLWLRKACISTQRNRSKLSLAGPSGSSRTTPPWGSARAEPRQRS